MIYGLSTRAFVEHGPAVMAIEAKASRSTSRWRALDADRRLALIESALRPANDFDGLPIAL